MALRTLCAAALIAFATAALAQDLPPGRGVVAPSGSVFTTEISPSGDSDDYVVQGFPGMSLTAVVRPTKGTSALVPLVSFIRPDGSITTTEDGFVLTHRKATYTARMTLDAVGWWQVRVRGADISVPTFPPATPIYSTGAYSVQITYKLPSSRPTLPIVTKGFVRTGTIDSLVDTDDFAFEGYPGQRLSAAVSPLSDELLPGLSLFRPDGSQVVGSAAISRRWITKFSMDQQGTWRVRVSGLDPAATPDPQHNNNTMGPYSLSVSLGRPPTVPTVLRDLNGQYKIKISAVGGATIGYSLRFERGSDIPDFNSFLDPVGRPVPGFTGKTSIPAFRIPYDLPIGDYTLTFDAPTSIDQHVTFASHVTLAKGARARKATLATVEPNFLLNGLVPVAGGPGVVVRAQASDLVDPNAPTGEIGLFLNDVALYDVRLAGDGISVTGRIPDGIPLGTYDVVVTSTSGQPAVRAAAFEIVPAPTLTAIDPPIGPSIGGFEITMTGDHFRPGQMAVEFDGNLQGAVTTVLNAKTLRFTLPSHSAGGVTFRAFDLGSQQRSNGVAFDYVSTPVIARMTPSLMPLLAGETVTLSGMNFAADDSVYLETSTKGVYENLSATQTTFVDFAHHSFVAPVRPKGDYAVFVQDSQGRPATKQPRTLTYYSFADATAASGLGSGTDAWDGVTTALGDFDGDGVADLFVSRVGGATATATPQTRVLKNDGHGHFTDVTTSVLPAATATEDWRADRIVAADVDLDGFVDLVLTTNDKVVLAANRSHTRILMNERRGGSASADDRVFRDRTAELFSQVRFDNPFYSGAGGVADSWRGLDLWVGDLDAANPGRPSIVITHDETKQETDVSCTPYCVSPFGGYSYGFYWGGSRAFVWDKSKNGGLGRYRFSHNFFPRRSGLRVPVAAPGGISIPICNANYGAPCVGKFTPFTGKRLAVGDVDHDSKMDIAVVSDHVFVVVNGLRTSQLQVAVQGFDATTGALVLDLTPKLTALSVGLGLSGDAVAIGATGFPNGNAFGSVAVTRRFTFGETAMTLLRFTGTGAATTVSDVTALALPAPDATDRFQASQLQFVDVDADGDQDLVLLSSAPPSAGRSALRFLRNEEINGQKGVFRWSLDPLLAPLVTPTDHLEGEALAIGDVSGDGFLDFAVTRSVPAGSGSQTRILVLDH